MLLTACRWRARARACRRGRDRPFDLGRRQAAGQDLEELFLIDGLGQIFIHAGGKAVLAITGHGMGSHGDDGQVGVARVAAQLAGCRVAVHLGHLGVHEDDIKRAIPHLIEGESAVRGTGDLGAGLVEELFNDLAVDGVVLGNKDLYTREARQDGCFLGSGLGRGDVLAGGRGDRVVERGWREWLLQHRRNTDGLGPLAKIVALVGRNHEHERAVATLAGEQALAGGETVHAR